MTGPRTEEPIHDSLYVKPSAINHPWAPFIAQAKKLLTLVQPATSYRAEGRPWNKARLEGVCVAIVLVVAAGIAVSDGRSQRPSVLGQQGATALEQQVPVAPALSKTTSATQPLLAQEEQRWTARTIPSKVSDRAIRVRYLSDDVTVRYFTPKPLLQHVSAKKIQVRHVSDDVTVRYFPSPPPVSSSSLRPEAPRSQ